MLPTGVGGDAARIIEHSRRQPDHKGEVAGAVILERVIGAAGTLVMVAIGLIVAIGRYDGIEYLVAIEVAFLLLVAAGFVLLFSKRAAVCSGRRPVRVEDQAGAGRSVRLSGDARLSLAPRALIVVLVVTIVMQLGRTVSIWLCGLAVGVDVSPLVYVILGPLLFLVMMVPFTINGLGVREAFFVAFLGRFGVGADAAFATGFLFFAVSIASCMPGGAILLWRSARPAVVRAERGT